MSGIFYPHGPIYRLRLQSSKGIAWGASAAWPTVRAKRRGRPFASHTMRILALSVRPGSGPEPHSPTRPWLVSLGRRRSGYRPPCRSVGWAPEPGFLLAQGSQAAKSLSRKPYRLPHAGDITDFCVSQV